MGQAKSDSFMTNGGGPIDASPVKALRAVMVRTESVFNARDWLAMRQTFRS